jgi:toxin ParE1/3/4
MKRKTEVKLLPLAEEDLVNIIEFIAEDKPSAAGKMADQFEKSLKQLETYPQLGRVARQRELAKLGYRYLVVGNYLIFYVIRPQFILVHRILNGAKDYLKLLS